VQPRITTELAGLRINTMAAMIPAMGCCGAKVYTVCRGKFSFVILLFSSADGQLLATFDAGTLTRLRTAAASALAARYLARSDSRVLAVFAPAYRPQLTCSPGAGAADQGDPRRRRARADAFAREMSELTGVPATVEDAAAALRGADVIVTGDALDDAAVRRGAGAGGMLHRRGRFSVRERRRNRCGGGRALRPCGGRIEGAGAARGGRPGAGGERRRAFLGPGGRAGCARHGAAPGRQADDEITLFDTVGFALEDVAIATLAYARLVELGKA